jgi:hypothetical protein
LTIAEMSSGEGPLYAKHWNSHPTPTQANGFDRGIAHVCLRPIGMEGPNPAIGNIRPEVKDS